MNQKKAKKLRREAYGPGDDYRKRDGPSLGTSGLKVPRGTRRADAQRHYYQSLKKDAK